MSHLVMIFSVRDSIAFQGVLKDLLHIHQIEIRRRRRIASLLVNTVFWLIGSVSVIGTALLPCQ